MDTYQQQKQRVLQLFQPVTALVQRHGRQDIVEHLNEAAQHLAEGKLLVLVCGEFKQGKSSLLNALLNEPDLFPVDIDIATSLVSTITFGESEKITVALGDQRDPNVQQKVIRRDDIADYVTERGNPNNQRQARMLVIESPNPQLKEGLVLVDTPGIGSLNARHTEVTYTFLPHADVVLYVSDAQRPLTTEDLTFITERIAHYCHNIVLVVTKIDMVENYETLVENNRKKLAESLGRPEEKIVIVPVSSKLKLEYLKSGDEEDLKDSNFPALESHVWDLINQQRGKILLLRALTQMNEGLADVARPLEAEMEACQRRSREELDDIERRSQAALDRQKALAAPDAPWRTQMRDGVADVRTRVPALFQEGIVKVRKQAELYMDEPHLLDNPAEIVSKVEVELDMLIADTGKTLERVAQELRDRLEKTTGLDLNPFEVGRLTLEKDDVSADLARIRKPNWWQKTMQVVRSTMSQGNLLYAIAGLFGAAINPLLGVPVAVGMLAANSKDAFEQMQDKSRTGVSRVVGKFIDDCQRRSNNTLQDAITVLERSVRDEMDARIKREREACDNAVQSVKSARKLSEEQAARRSTELKDQLQQVIRVRQRIEEMAVKIAGR